MAFRDDSEKANVVDSYIGLTIIGHRELHGGDEDLAACIMEAAYELSLGSRPHGYKFAVLTDED
ncbi:MAG: hypothetical protein PHE17_05285 [Thiothrix sp.]|uniref:hypothetical protein n=1 Tax=Thiothrix sp. TaxID=1032 RepID=UPI00260B209E|nr:hypothetical protein [Thiothrix sp.]MDD5392415.1 hypothetical protein [Thiothrix sp.]